MLSEQKSLLIAVATGGPAIKEVDAIYQKRQRALTTRLRSVGLANPFRWNTLWDWYGLWSAGEMPRYQDRRRFISEAATPVEDELAKRRDQPGVVDWGSPEDVWQSLEARLEGLKAEVGAARDLDGWQDVGRRAREIIIDAADEVWSSDYLPDRAAEPKQSDAKSRIEYYLAARLPGTAHAELRSLIKKALELANKVTHSDTITAVDAYASAQATVLVVRTLQKIEEGAVTPDDLPD